MRIANKPLYVLLLALCAWTSALAWHEYRPMVVEGRLWNLGLDTFVIEGDTIIDGVAYKNVNHYEYYTPEDTDPMRKTWCCALREDDKRVYIYDHVISASEKLLCDFSWGPTLSTDYELEDVKTICAMNAMVHGKECRVVLVDNVGYYRVLVEGVGYIDGPLSWWLPDGHVFYCLDGNETIYEYTEDKSREDYLRLYRNNSWSSIATLDGEVNGDRRVDIGDINAAIDMMLGRPVRPGWDDVAADMDLSGTLDIADVNAVINVMLGRE